MTTKKEYFHNCLQIGGFVLLTDRLRQMKVNLLKK